MLLKHMKTDPPCTFPSIDQHKYLLNLNVICMEPILINKQEKLEFLKKGED